MENSPLANLPAELRNRIYEVVFNTPCEVHISYNTLELSMPCPNLNLIETFALAKTCKTIREETKGYATPQAVLANGKFFIHGAVPDSQPDGSGPFEDWHWRTTFEGEYSIRELEFVPPFWNWDVRDGRPRAGQREAADRQWQACLKRSKAVLFDELPKYTIGLSIRFSGFDENDEAQAPQYGLLPYFSMPITRTAEDNEMAEVTIASVVEAQRAMIKNAKLDGKITMKQYSGLQADLSSFRRHLAVRMMSELSETIQDS